MAILTYFFLIAVNILLAYSNNKVRLKRIKEHNKKQIEHFWYALGYSFLCLWLNHWQYKSWHFASFLLLHLSVFPVFYNIFYPQSWFFLSKTSDSKIDRFMVWVGFKSTEWVNISALAISLYLIIFK